MATESKEATESKDAVLLEKNVADSNDAVKSKNASEANDSALSKNCTVFKTCIVSKDTSLSEGPAMPKNASVSESSSTSKDVAECKEITARNICASSTQSVTVLTKPHSSVISPGLSEFINPIKEVPEPSKDGSTNSGSLHSESSDCVLQFDSSTLKEGSKLSQEIHPELKTFKSAFPLKGTSYQEAFTAEPYRTDSFIATSNSDINNGEKIASIPTNSSRNEISTLSEVDNLVLISGSNEVSISADNLPITASKEQAILLIEDSSVGAIELSNLSHQQKTETDSSLKSLNEISGNDVEVEQLSVSSKVNDSKVISKKSPETRAYVTAKADANTESCKMGKLRVSPAEKSSSIVTTSADTSVNLTSVSSCKNELSTEVENEMVEISVEVDFTKSVGQRKSKPKLLTEDDSKTTDGKAEVCEKNTIEKSVKAMESGKASDGDILKSIVSVFGINSAVNSSEEMPMEVDAVTSSENSSELSEDASKKDASINGISTGQGAVQTDFDTGSKNSEASKSSLGKEPTDCDEQILTVESSLPVRDIEKAILEKSTTDSSLFLDEESCDTVMRKPEPVSDIREESCDTVMRKPELVSDIREESCDTVMRKPEPVSDIREETLAGDPRLEAPEISINDAPSLDIDDSSIDASKTTNDIFETSIDQSNAADDNEEQDDEDDAPKKTPKRRKKPRRSMFYKPRPDRKRKEKEKAESAQAAAATAAAAAATTTATAAPAASAAATVGGAGGSEAVGSPVTNLDEDSQGSSSAKEKKEVRRFRCEVVVPESTEAFTVDKVMEYVWPLEGGYGEHYFVQEHISQYIGISSFKRKYPDLRRRPIDMAERDYLKELGLVSEIACDMGLTAVRSEDVMDILFADFPLKFEELSRNLNERRDHQLKEQGKVDYQVANIDKSRLHEYGRQAAEEAACWNAALNREKREERRFSFDLQTFTLQQPIGRGKKLPHHLTRVGHYPVAVLPGQYTDFCRRYKPEELRRLPLNSVYVEPLSGDTPKEEAGQPGSEAPAGLDAAAGLLADAHKSEVPEEKALLCKVCFLGKEKSKTGKAEGLIVCAKCSSSSHASCVDLNPSMIPRINSYGWQCMECKNCMQCNSAEDEDKMIFCDLCDRGYHIYCVGLRRVPNGRWHCKECAMCNSCGSRSPASGENIKNAEWQHEFRKRKDNKIGYATTLCVPCDRLWKRRQYCYVCLKVYRSIPEDCMVRCANCPKYIHREKPECSSVFEGEFLCLPCFKSSKSTVLNHNRIIAAAKKKMASGF
ncbi:Zinc finger PHD-finger [Trinorchestia longiramus]|nr:Zinc finger PHD-finger [Trinorchestia longiramus]